MRRAWLVAASVAFASSWALPWSETSAGRRSVGWSLLFTDDGYRWWGMILVIVWTAAIMMCATGRGRCFRAVPAAIVLAMVALLGWAILDDSTRHFGVDSAGHFVEWIDSGRPAVGYHLAAGSALVLAAVAMPRAREGA